MSAHLDYDKCPVCLEIRNTVGMKRHLQRAHPLYVLTQAAA